MQKIACASITWGDRKTKEQLFQMLREMKDCGYDGAEIGLDKVFLIESRAELEELGIEIVSVHTAVDIRSADAEEECEKLKKSAARAKEIGASFVFISSIFFKGKGEEDYRAEAKLYDRFGEIVTGLQMQFCFHNHNWEFKNNRLGLQILTKETDPLKVFLVPDLGWVMRGGMEPVDFLREFGDRVRALHFKEFTFDDRFTELGRGVVDFETAYDYIKDRELWIVAEQDTCEGTPAQAAAENAAYLRRLIGGENA